MNDVITRSDPASRGLNRRSAATRISMKRCLFPQFSGYWRAALLGAFALAGTAASGTPAVAQFYGPPIMREDAVVRQLRQQGFRQLTAPTLNGVVYYLDGVDPRGRPVRIIARAADARILALHPQPGGRWARIDPDDDAEWIDRRWRRHEQRRGDRERWSEGWSEGWEDGRRERHSRLPDDGSPDDGWQDAHRTGPRGAEGRRTPLPEIDGGATEQPAPPARRSPERVTASPLPPPATARDPDLPAPTIRNPTIVKRSPTAIPRDPAATKPAEPQRKIGTEATRSPPAPGVGTRENPRVIDMTPAPPKPPAGTSAPTGAAAPPAAATKKAAANPAPKAAAPAQTLPPPAVLDAPVAAPKAETPFVPPAPLE